MNRRLFFLIAIIAAGTVGIVYLLTTKISFSITSSINIEHNASAEESTSVPKQMKDTTSLHDYKNSASAYKEKALKTQNVKEQKAYWLSAVSEWKAALELSQDDKILLNELGYGCFYLMNLSPSKDEALEKFRNGVEYFDKVLTLDPNFYWSLFGLGMLFFDVAERTNSPVEYLNKAIGYFDKGFQYDADYIWGHLSKAWAYFKIGNTMDDRNYYRKAIPEFQRVLEIDPNNQLAKDGIRFSNEKL